MLKLNEANTKEVKALITANNKVNAIKGSVAYLATKEGKGGLAEKDITAYLATLGYNAPKRSTGFRGDLYEALEAGEVSLKDFDTLIANASDNTVNNRKHFNAIRELCNTARANVIAEFKANASKGGK